MWNPLPVRGTPTVPPPHYHAPDSSVLGAPLKMWASRALLPPAALASRGIWFPWPSEPLGLGPSPMLLLSESWFGENRC